MIGCEHCPQAEGESTVFPVPSLDKSDLLWSCGNSVDPETEALVLALTEDDMASIADKLGDTLREDYWTLMADILRAHLRHQNQAMDE